MCLKRQKSGFLIRLYNSSPQYQKTAYLFMEAAGEIEFYPFEVKSYHYFQGSLYSCNIIADD